MNIYLTLDYELFLGEKTGTPENCLIRPMDELCKVADKHHFKFVIFVDATYLLRMQQMKGQFKEVDRQYDLVSNHVKSLAEKGHDIELHFHPQWLYSNWDEDAKQWKMDRDHYKLSDLSIEEAKSSLRAAKNLLDEIVGYETKAFRAGGFCLDTFNEYKETFQELRLVIDSSVARYTCVRTPVHSYDYRQIPQEQIYRFSNSIKKKDDNGQFLEMSITGVHWNVLTFWLNIRSKLEKRKPTLEYKDGKGIVDKKQTLAGKIVEVLTRNAYLASIDGLWSNAIEDYYKYVLKKGWSEMILIGHPKNATDLSIANLEWFFDNYQELKVETFKNLK